MFAIEHFTCLLLARRRTRSKQAGKNGANAVGVRMETPCSAGRDSSGDDDVGVGMEAP